MGDDRVADLLTKITRAEAAQGSATSLVLGCMAAMIGIVAPIGLFIHVCYGRGHEDPDIGGFLILAFCELLGAGACLISVFGVFSGISALRRRTCVRRTRAWVGIALCLATIAFWSFLVLWTLTWRTG